MDIDNSMNKTLEISESEIREQLKNINIFKSFGPDAVHPKLLNALSDDSGFIAAVRKLYMCCIESRRIPEQWKKKKKRKKKKNILIGMYTNIINYYY